MDNKDAIKIHLTLNYEKATDTRVYFSTLCGALKDSRKMTGRNILNGMKDNSNKFGHLGSWLGAMGYITILDQIGKCYRPKNVKPIKKTSAIIKTLRYFSDLSLSEINAIYALRNAFFHDFSLVNIDNPKYIHRFIVDNHSTNPLVILPIEKWDGVYEHRNRNNVTYINLQSLGDLVEDIYKKLLELNSENKLNIELKGGANELLMRYVIVTGEKVI